MTAMGGGVGSVNTASAVLEFVPIAAAEGLSGTPVLDVEQASEAMTAASTIPTRVE